MLDPYSEGVQWLQWLYCRGHFDAMLWVHLLSKGTFESSSVEFTNAEALYVVFSFLSHACICIIITQTLESDGIVVTCITSDIVFMLANFCLDWILLGFVSP